MVATIDGRALARTLSTETAAAVAHLRETSGVVPGLAVVLVGADPASEVYVARKVAETVRVGMRSIKHRLDTTTHEDELLALISSAVS
ncbi:MAG: tetrahydrofolate dehydrogenase/cyclohydrolase catalytic domain-containing protein [Sphingomonadales bacterium]